MIGRPYLWGLAANRGTRRGNVLEILRQGISETLYGLGRAPVHDLTRDDVIVPDGFTLSQKP
jgi:pre-mycofactocin synthase